MSDTDPLWEATRAHAENIHAVAASFLALPEGFTPLQLLEMWERVSHEASEILKLGGYGDAEGVRAEEKRRRGINWRPNPSTKFK